MTNSEICLPSKALSQDGPPPAEGETVEIQNLKGVVTRTEGDQTYFRPTEINGRAIDSAEEENNEGDQPADDGLPTEEQLRTRAAQEDEESEY